MAEVGALSPEFAEVLASMEKFRNRLVHLYWKVDDRQMHQFLCSRLQDFRRFLKEMAQYLALSEIPECARGKSHLFNTAFLFNP